MFYTEPKKDLSVSAGRAALENPWLRFLEIVYRVKDCIRPIVSAAFKQTSCNTFKYAALSRK